MNKGQLLFKNMSCGCYAEWHEHFVLGINVPQESVLWHLLGHLTLFKVAEMS